MRAAILLIATLCIAAFLTQCTSDSATTIKSPNGKFAVSWNEDRTIRLIRLADHRILFVKETAPRYTLAKWNPQSSRCLLVDAPDNANSTLILFIVSADSITTKEIDYGLISSAIEDAYPRLIRKEPDLTRSGIEDFQWLREDMISLVITYNNFPVSVTIKLDKQLNPEIKIFKAEQGAAANP
jgi:hypothetical protein